MHCDAGGERGTPCYLRFRVLCMYVMTVNSLTGMHCLQTSFTAYSIMEEVSCWDLESTVKLGLKTKGITFLHYVFFSFNNYF